MSMRVARIVPLALVVLAISAYVFPMSHALGAEHAESAENSGQVEPGHEGDEPEGQEGHESEALNLNPLEPKDLKANLGIWTGVIFVLLFLVLGKFAWGPIADGLDKREARVAAEIQAAEKANADAKELLAGYQKKLDAAGDEVRQLIDQAKRDAEAAGHQILQKAREEAEAEKRRAVEDIELATSGALKELAERSASLAVDLAGKIVHARLSESEHTALINEAVAKFSQLEPGKN